MNIIGAPLGLVEGLMNPFARLSVMYAFRVPKSGSERELIGPQGSSFPGRRGLSRSYGRRGGRVFAACSENTSAKSWYAGVSLAKMDGWIRGRVEDSG